MDAATTVGPGSVVVFDVPRSPINMYMTVTGSPTGFACALEGSLDGVNWTELVRGGTNSPIVVTTDLALMARANIIQMDGGTSPTVTATIVAKGG